MPVKLLGECAFFKPLSRTLSPLSPSGDRIAIMAKGKLRCLGTGLRLKQKFGSGYQARGWMCGAEGAPRWRAALCPLRPACPSPQGESSIPL